MKAIKKEGSRIYLDGPKTCREYMITPKTVFGSSILHPGQTGGIGPGHPEGHEVSYVNRGEALMHNTQTDELYGLHEGDVILVYEGGSHELTNIGTDMVVITWSCVPKID